MATVQDYWDELISTLEASGRPIDPARRRTDRLPTPRAPKPRQPRVRTLKKPTTAAQRKRREKSKIQNQARPSRRVNRAAPKTKAQQKRLRESDRKRKLKVSTLKLAQRKPRAKKKDQRTR